MACDWLDSMYKQGCYVHLTMQLTNKQIHLSWVFFFLFCFYHYRQLSNRFRDGIRDCEYDEMKTY